MGGSLLKGWLESGAVDEALVVDPAAPILPKGLTAYSSLDEVSDPLPGAILLAVKPQLLHAALEPLRTRLPDEATVISIAAGKTIGWLAERLGATARIIRTMPNTPAAIGRGITVCCAGPGVHPDQRALASRLMGAVGDVAWIDDETLMHAVTAVSGSGPAYVFLMIEALTEAGRAAGLPVELAGRLAGATVTGAGELARLSPDAPSKLRADVTSPAGTTAAALDILMAQDGLADLMRRAVAAASARSEALAAG